MDGGEEMTTPLNMKGGDMRKNKIKKNGEETKLFKMRVRWKK